MPHIFSYGSNLLLARIQARAPSARFVTRGALPGHVLRWHKLSRDRSGKCDAVFTGDPTDQLWGGVFELSPADKLLLDQAEGLGTGYDQKFTEIECGTPDNRPRLVQASLYIALKTESSALPYDWYKAFVLAGARECRLPTHYIENLKATPSMRDPDAARNAMNRALLPGHLKKV